MHLCRGCFVVTYELVLVIDHDVIFIAIMRFLVFLRPARIGIFLGSNMGFFLKTRRSLPSLDLIVFFPRVSLSRHIDKARIDDLALTGFVASLIKLMVEVVEQRFDQL